MEYKESITDIINREVVNVHREIHDIKIFNLGTRISVMRITLGAPDMSGYQESSWESSIINNVVMKYPTNDFELTFDENSTTGNIETDSLDLWEILPTIMNILWERDTTEDPVSLDNGDLIIDIKLDEHGNKIPIIFEVSRLRGHFRGKEMARKEYELAKYRGVPEDDIKMAIDTFITES